MNCPWPALPALMWSSSTTPTRTWFSGRLLLDAWIRGTITRLSRSACAASSVAGADVVGLPLGGGEGPGDVAIEHAARPSARPRSRGAPVMFEIFMAALRYPVVFTVRLLTTLFTPFTPWAIVVARCFVASLSTTPFRYTV